MIFIVLLLFLECCLLCYSAHTIAHACMRVRKVDCKDTKKYLYLQDFLYLIAIFFALGGLFVYPGDNCFTQLFDGLLHIFLSQSGNIYRFTYMHVHRMVVSEELMFVHYLIAAGQ